MISRRGLLASALLPAVARAARPKGVLIESHVHLFANDPQRFPYNSAAYKPRPNPVEEFLKFATEVRLDHAVIVHPEPYQDDHRYLEFCLTQGPKGFFRGTCLFDPIDPETPKRLQALVRRNSGRIVAFRIHEIHPAGTPSTKTGAIRDRDLADPQMAATWRAAHELGLSIQIHCIPHYASQIGELAAKFPQMPVLIDHLARPGQGTPEEYEQVLKLGDLPNVYMKFSGTGVTSASREGSHLDAKALVRKVYGAFGAGRIVWGELGDSMAAFDKAVEQFDLYFDFAPEAEKAKIRGTNAQKLFGF
jgi:predicted TIM-barrel fold metal-dependent hydrolase